MIITKAKHIITITNIMLRIIKKKRSHIKVRQFNRFNKMNTMKLITKKENTMLSLSIQISNITSLPSSMHSLNPYSKIEKKRWYLLKSRVKSMNGHRNWTISPTLNLETVKSVIYKFQRSSKTKQLWRTSSQNHLKT